MKPLAKTMKTAYYDNNNKDSALKQLLSSYRSTPHPATGEPPGAVMFRHGYKTEFPQRVLSDESVAAAFENDQQQKLARGAAVNATRHRTPSSFRVGDHVYLRNRKTSKFQPDFGPETFENVDLRVNGATVVSDSYDTIYKRQLFDITPITKIPMELIMTSHGFLQ